MGRERGIWHASKFFGWNETGTLDINVIRLGHLDTMMPPSFKCLFPKMKKMQCVRFVNPPKTAIRQEKTNSIENVLQNIFTNCLADPFELSDWCELYNYRL